MSIENPEMKITFDDAEFLATPDNTVLFNYIAVHGLYNHIFLTREMRGEVHAGTYIFQSSEAYAEMAQYMLENDYPAHVNLRTVAQCDIDAFDNMIEASGRFEDYVPGEWLDEA